MTSQPSSPMPHRHPIDVQINIIISEIMQRDIQAPKDSTPECNIHSVFISHVLHTLTVLYIFCDARDQTE